MPTPKRVVLGLDLATHSGYSVWSASRESLLAADGIDCSIRTASEKDPDPPGKRFDLLRGMVLALIEEYRVTDVYHERSVGGPTAGGAPALVSVGMTAIVQQVCFEREIPCTSVSTGTLKKHATGNGGHDTKKQHMIAAAYLAFGRLAMGPKLRQPTKSKPWKYDDDVVDAVWAGHFGFLDVHQRKRVHQYSFELVSPTKVRYCLLETDGTSGGGLISV